MPAPASATAGMAPHHAQYVQTPPPLITRSTHRFMILNSLRTLPFEYRPHQRRPFQGVKRILGSPDDNRKSQSSKPRPRPGLLFLAVTGGDFFHREKCRCDVAHWHETDMPGWSDDVRSRGDCVAEVPKRRAAKFPPKDKTSGNRRSMSLQSRHRSRQ